MVNDHPEVDLYTQLKAVEAAYWQDTDKRHRTTAGQHTRHLISQNVRGFRVAERRKWMQAWKARSTKRSQSMWLLQETHLQTREEARELEREWRTLWGSRSDEKLLFWGASDRRKGGVAILIHPDLAGKIEPVSPTTWNARRMMVIADGRLVVNIYAPNMGAEREQFFRELCKWIPGTEGLIVGGDFNCVLNSHQDRITLQAGNNSSGERPISESQALENLISNHQLVDARHLLGTAASEAELTDLEHFTYWHARGASRIDRFYVDVKHSHEIQWLSAQDPGRSSDHQALHLELKQGRPIPERNRHHAINYLRQREGHDGKTVEAMGLGIAALRRNLGVAEWEAFARHLRYIMRATSKVTKKRRHRLRRKLWRQLTARAKSRVEVLQGKDQIDDDYQQLKYGLRLDLTPETAKWLYQRVTIREKSQAVSEIHIEGGSADPSISTATAMARAWDIIFGKSHAKTPPSEIKNRLQRFVTIPDSKRTTPADNKMLMATITTEEISGAIKSLKRMKASGSDQIGNDFYKDFEPELAPRLVKLFNELLAGREPPASFLQALVIPLQKKGDSPNALDYRPIMLLQTSYKLFAKILADRLQTFLDRIIGSHQQGFVRNRQIRKTIAMMLAHLRQAYNNPDENIDDAAGVLLIDIRKAYDTLDRDFMLAVLEAFGFDPAFVTLIHNLHCGTTAQFLVNGELSEEREIKSGIRQGCPLAPLLFLLAVEILSLKLIQEPDISGLRLAGATSAEHKVSGFVDDSAVFLKRCGHLQKVLKLLKVFGNLSGLRIQPEKSCFIFLNTAITRAEYRGIPVLRSGGTVRYLGLQVGVGDLHDSNWADRKMKLQRRMLPAIRMKLSVEDKITVFNTIALPSILFTAAYIPPKPSVLAELVNFQKQFVWQNKLSWCATRNKINPALLHLPRPAGGAGLFSIGLSISTLLANHSSKWLLEREDEYTQAWHTLVHPRTTFSERCCCLQPTERRPQNTLIDGPWAEGWWILSSILKTRGQSKEPKEWEATIQQWTDKASIEWVSGADLQISWPAGPIPTRKDTPEWTTAFWPRWNWSNNAWITDGSGKPLKTSAHKSFASCRLEQLCIREIGLNRFSLQPPLQTRRKNRPREDAKIWAAAIILNLPPRLRIYCQVPLFTICNKEIAQTDHCWQPHSNECVESNMKERTPKRLHKTANGIGWTESGAFSERETEVVLSAHPDLHRMPWKPRPEATASNHLRLMNKERFRILQQEQTKGTQEIAKRILAAARTSHWKTALLHYEPLDAWRRAGELSAFQAWFRYRMVTGQLNLYYEGRQERPQCRVFESCGDSKETLEHITWNCGLARMIWKLLIERWIGKRASDAVVKEYAWAVATRRAPNPSRDLIDRLEKDWGHRNADMKQELRLIWRVCTTSIAASLWLHRNAVVHNGAAPLQSPAKFWSQCVIQTQAIAARLGKNGKQPKRGLQLKHCIEVINSTTMTGTLSTLAMTYLVITRDAVLGRWIGLGGTNVARLKLSSTAPRSSSFMQFVLLTLSNMVPQEESGIISLHIIGGNDHERAALEQLHDTDRQLPKTQHRIRELLHSVHLSQWRPMSPTSNEAIQLAWNQLPIAQRIRKTTWLTETDTATATWQQIAVAVAQTVATLEPTNDFIPRISRHVLN